MGFTRMATMPAASIALISVTGTASFASPTATKRAENTPFHQLFHKACLSSAKQEGKATNHPLATAQIYIRFIHIIKEERKNWLFWHLFYFLCVSQS